MAWENGFFNSVNGDRVYNAESMNKIFEGLITDGVYESVGDKLAVSPNSGMAIQIGTGRGWFNHHWVSNNSEYVITLNAADVVLNRYAAICIRVNENDDTRTAEPFVKYSDFATDPQRPTMERTAKVNEYCLAYVFIPAKATSISAANIEDTRGDEELCGWVTGLIEQLSTATLFTQWQALFTDWFMGLQDIIDENVEVTLVNALPKSLTVELTTTGWTEAGGTYVQTVQIMGMNTTKSVIVQANSSTKDEYNASEVVASAQGANSMTFTATKLPSTNIMVDVLHMGV